MIMSDARSAKTYAVGDVPWIYPHKQMPPRGQKLNLLQEGGTAIHGEWSWYGGYIAWQYLFRREKEEEAEALAFIASMAKQGAK